MSDSANPLLGNFGSFGKLVPGFDFLQNLAKGATQNIPQMPNLGNWVAPTINVEELEKRIAELKAVQFWLDQNATALKATIQALEVQKMTLATLKGMNFSMGDVANAFKLKAADTVNAFAAAASNASVSAPAASAPAAAAKRPARRAAPNANVGATPPPGVVDPMQWWGALTQQFQTIAASAMKDAAKNTAMDVTKNMASGLAKDAVKTAMDTAKSVGKGMTDIASKTVAAGVGRTLATAAKAAKVSKSAPRKRR